MQIYPLPAKAMNKWMLWNLGHSKGSPSSPQYPIEYFIPTSSIIPTHKSQQNLRWKTWPVIKAEFADADGDGDAVINGQPSTFIKLTSG